MKKTVSILLAAGISLGGIAIAYAKNRAPELPVQTIGTPLNCVNTNHIRSTKIVDDRTIDFEMTGKKLYRNTLPYSCPSLKFEERFSYKPTGSQLCSVDIIRVLNNYGGRLQEGAGCGLGKFQQIEKVQPIK
jgi:hypothetical protein